MNIEILSEKEYEVAVGAIEKYRKNMLKEELRQKAMQELIDWYYKYKDSFKIDDKKNVDEILKKIYQQVGKQLFHCYW